MSNLPEIATASRHECSAILAAVAARLVILDAEAMDEVEDRALNITDAATLLGISTVALYRSAHGRHSGLLIDTGTKRLLFSQAKIRAYLRRDGRRDAGSMPPIASGRRGLSRVALTEPSALHPRASEPGGR
jgi:hypothetical protein